MKTVLLFLCVLMSPLILWGQKTEIERKARKAEVPKAAIAWMRDAYELRRKVKWYYEEDQDRQSYEAKLKYRRQWHSVEFSMEGQIEDVEVRINWSEVPPKTREALTQFFEENYSRFDIKKIQRQWTGEAEDLEDAIDENEPGGITTRYEIEYHGKDDKDNELWEGLFDADGQLIRKRTIELQPADNLRY